MANANITKIGVTDAVALEEAAKNATPQETTQTDAVAPNISERRVVGRREVPTPSGQIIVIENL